MSNEDPLEALKKAAGRSMSADELHAQKLSFVLSTLDDTSDATRHRVEKQISEHDGRET